LFLSVHLFTLDTLCEYSSSKNYSTRVLALLELLCTLAQPYSRASSPRVRDLTVPLARTGR